MILKHHEARLWVSSAGPRGGSVVARSVPGSPGVQSAHPTHNGPSKRPVNDHENSTVQVPGKKEWRRKKVWQRDKNKRMLWERSGGEEGVKVVWKERNRRREVSCRGTITVGQWNSLQRKVHCCFSNGVILSSLSSSLKPTPLHSQSGWARYTVVKTKKTKHLRRWLDQASFHSSILNVGHKSQRLKQSGGKKIRTVFLNASMECVNHKEFAFFFLFFFFLHWQGTTNPRNIVI